MIIGSEELWDPNDWEAFVYSLVQDRHGPLNVQKVPARHQGDSGIDYYSTASRVVYQCYSVEEPCSVADRASKQNNKITEDLNTFCSNNAFLRNLFAGSPVARWVLVVPLHDSKAVNEHLAKKTIDVRAKGLPYVDQFFEALVQDPHAFPASSIEERRRQAATITLSSRSPTDDEIQDWTASQNTLVQNLIRKLRKRPGAQEATQAARAISWFLERENLLEDLRSSAPQLSQRIGQVLSRHTTRLELTGPPNNDSQRVLRDAVQEIAGALSSEISNLSTESAEKIALGTVADWLLRCPLDYPPFENAS
jgi:hypothetical protein